LRIEEVGTRVGPDSVDATVVLALGNATDSMTEPGCRRFVGAARAQGRDHDGWRLVAAASVGAIQRYLQQCHPVEPTPRVQLLDTALTATSLGQEAIHATVRIAHGDQQLFVLGSALVRNDRCSTAAAAALDAVQRQLAAFRPSAVRISAPPAREAVTTLLPSPPDLTAEPDPEPPPIPHPRGTFAPHRSPLARVALALHFTPSELHAAVVDEVGRLLTEARRPCQPSLLPEEVLSLAVESCQEAVAGLARELEPPDALGLALAGGGDGDSISLSPGPPWYESDLVNSLAEQLNLPVHPIREAAAVAIAEARLGAAQTVDPLLFLDVGDDLEAIVVYEDRLVDLRQAGHMVVDRDGPRCSCGQLGCWQALAGCEALVGRAIKAVTGGTPSALAPALSRGYSAVTPALVCRLAMSGDAVARDAVEQTGHCLALGLGNLMSLFNPEAVMISADPTAVRVALRHATELALKSSRRAETFSRCVFLSPELGPAAPLLGAAAWATLRNGRGGDGKQEGWSES
jgi:glucokinase